METKHTQGIWTVGANVANDYEPRYTEVLSGEKRIAKASYGKDWEEHQANARLIDAAPELLEACLYAYAELHQDLNFEFSVLVNNLREAVQKATQP